MAQEKVESAEIASLNLDALDIEELEQRLELAAADLGAAAWICGTDGNDGGGCNVVCYCNTVDGCPALLNCPVDVMPIAQ